MRFPVGVDFALKLLVDTEARYQRLCRVGMLAAALLHWVAAALVLWPISGHGTWNYSGARERPRLCYVAPLQSPEHPPAVSFTPVNRS